MKPISFPEQTVVIAKDQPQYLPLPAHVEPHDKYDPSRRMTFCWALTWRERLTLLMTGRLWHQVLTFNSPLQPQLLLVKKPPLPSPAVLGKDTQGCPSCGKAGPHDCPAGSYSGGKK